MTDSSTVSAGELLRTARRRAGLTQAELAARAGVTQSVISAYESGARQPSLPVLQRLVEASGLTLSIRVRRASPLARLTGPIGRRVRLRRHEIKAAAARHGASNVRVFGSVARGTETPESDVDLLVDLGADVGLLGLSRLEHELSALLGTRVDVVPAVDLKPDVAADVLGEAVAL